MTARKVSTSGAYMSQYDNEVETRVKALEAEIKSLKAQCDAHSKKSVSKSDSGGDGRLDELIRILKMNPSLNIEKLSKGML
jgi:Fe-S cluster assembly ATPase SufC